MAPTRRAGELWFALALLVFALAALWQAYGISGLTGLSTAGVFPMLAAATMVVAALAIVAGAVRRPLEDGAGLRLFLGEALPARLVVLVALIVGFLAAMPWLGFMPAAAVFLYASIAILWRRGLVRPLLVTLLALVLIWLTFRLAFQIVLPRGTLIPNLL